MLDFFINFVEGHIMKRSILALAVASTLSACSTNRPVDVSDRQVPPGQQQAISEQRLAASDFRREGVKVFYTFSGELSAIETTGYAPVWGNSGNARREAYRVAELEAKKTLNDFISQESISSSKSVNIISRNLEKAKDNKTNNLASNRGNDSVPIVTTDDELERTDRNEKETSARTNSTTRDDALRIASTVETTIRVQSKGILGGLLFKEGEVVDDGKTVRVVYRWDKKNNPGRIQLRNQMLM